MADKPRLQLNGYARIIALTLGAILVGGAGGQVVMPNAATDHGQRLAKLEAIQGEIQRRLEGIEQKLDRLLERKATDDVSSRPHYRDLQRGDPARRPRLGVHAAVQGRPQGDDGYGFHH